jgi:phenylacetate-CoA ligase
MTSLLNKIYTSLPVPIQNVGISLYGFIWNRRRFGGIYNAQLKGFKSREFFSETNWKEYQIQELRKILVHAFQTVPFYKDHLSATGFTTSDLKKFKLEDLDKLPLLTKNDLRQYGTSTLLSSEPEPGSSFFSSSGSSGTPVRIKFSKPMHQRWSAVFEARIRNWAGVNRFMRRGMIGGRTIMTGSQQKPPFYRYNLAEKQTYFSITHLSESHADDYVQGIINNNVEYMTGYAISNYLLAFYINRKRIQVPPLKAVITSSEKLTPNMRAELSKAYQCKVYDSWSGIEACGLISECEHGSLHISPDVGIIELLTPDGQPVEPGQTGEIVCTGFLNYDQPLIRYKIGDLAQLATNQHCDCGRKMPVVSELVGRNDDIVKLSNGSTLASFNRLFADIPGIIEVQVIQHTFEQFDINLVYDSLFRLDDLQEQIRTAFFQRIGSVDLHFTIFDKIPRNPNGKFKAVISLIP